MINECASWQLAARIGPPVSELVAVTVLREMDGRVGALSQRLPGTIPAYQAAAYEVHAAAFFDVVSGQQDRHAGNAVWDATDGLGLFDHGFSFFRPGDRLNDALFWRVRYESQPDLTNKETTQLRTLLNGAVAPLEPVLPADRFAALINRMTLLVNDRQLPKPRGAF